jgi:hypothetical protein
MDNEVNLHKLQKYRLKLRSNPSNYVYQQKVTYYGNMMGGENIFRNCKFWKPVYDNKDKTIYNYGKLFVNIYHNNNNNNFYIGTVKTRIDESGNIIGDNDEIKRLISKSENFKGNGFLYNNKGCKLHSIIIEKPFNIKAKIIDNTNISTYKNPIIIDLLKENSKIRF